MLKSMSFASLVAAVFIFSSSTLFADVTITIKNGTQWTFDEFYLNYSADESWGPDHLGKEVIKPGGTFALQGVPVGKFDARIVDEEGDECIISDVSIKGSEIVTFTDEMLVGCQHATEEEAEE